MADTTSNMSYLTTVGGYVTVFGAGYLLYYVSTQKARKRAASTQSKPARSSQPEPRKEEKKKRQPRVDGSSESQGSSEKTQSKARSKAQASASASASNAFSSSIQATEAPDDGVDNAEFAKQLSKAKQGKQFSKDTDSGKKQKEKSVKQSKANMIDALALNEAPAVSESVTTSGADADDDESPAHSPDTSAQDAGGVADMLEPTPSGPSVLRLTDTEAKEKPQRKTKAPEPVETKKQRQNRKKAEAAKAAREESEKERRALEEKQRRAARIAEGRAAKDGSQYTNARAKASAWNQGAPNGSSATAASTGTNGAQPLLDTFEAPPTEAPKSGLPKARAGAPEPESAWMSSLPSEEEQLEMLKDEADEWNTVKTKKSGKKEAPSVSADAPVAPAATVSKPTKTASAGNVASAASKNPSTFGSFSALTTNEGPDDNAEEEWDV